MEQEDPGERLAHQKRHSLRPVPRERFDVQRMKQIEQGEALAVKENDLIPDFDPQFSPMHSPRIGSGDQGGAVRKLRSRSILNRPVHSSLGQIQSRRKKGQRVGRHRSYSESRSSVTSDSTDGSLDLSFTDESDFERYDCHVTHPTFRMHQ